MTGPLVEPCARGVSGGWRRAISVAFSHGMRCRVHQTKYLTELGFDPSSAAWALGLVSLVAVPGQIALGHLSDRIGREWVWSIGNGGFVLSCVALLALDAAPSAPLLWVMVVTQGTLGYSLTSVMGATSAASFGGRNFGSIFGMVMLAAILGGAAGPWLAGTLHDLTGSYSPAFWLSIGYSAFSAISIWRAAPRRGDGVCIEGGD